MRAWRRSSTTSSRRRWDERWPARRPGLAAAGRGGRVPGLLPAAARFGFPVAPEQVRDFMQAVTLLGPRSMADIREAGLAILAPPPERRGEFDAHFRGFFYGEHVPRIEGEEEETDISDDGGAEQQQVEVRRAEEGGDHASGDERLGVRRFERDGAGLDRFGRALADALPRRRSLRHVSTSSRGHARPAALAARHRPRRRRRPLAAAAHPQDGAAPAARSHRRVRVDEGAYGGLPQAGARDRPGMPGARKCSPSEPG